MSFCRSLLRFSALTCLSALLFSLPAPALAPAVHHPLDALTPAEYWVVYKAIRAAGQVLHIRVLGLVSIATDVTPELARATIGSLDVLGALQASPTVKAALADRIR